MSYNIFTGGQNRLDFIIAAIKEENPDFLTINEANDFLADDKKVLKKFSQGIGLPYYEVAPAKSGYDLAFFSKMPIKKSEIIMSQERPALLTEVDSELGPLSIVSLHLSPSSEDVRLSETAFIIAAQKEKPAAVIMGDMNSLSREDGYKPEIIYRFNDRQINKFASQGKLQFEAVDTIIKAGYKDAAVQSNKNQETTVPTPSNKDSAHSDLRLDYIFLSEPLAPRLSGYRVVKNELTGQASDHYPIVAVLN